jgi:hypothetical protein
MRKPFLTMTVAQIVAIAPVVLLVLTILALVLSVGTDFLGPGI